MPDLALELAHLALTERHIVDAELCVSRQRMLVARMRGVGGGPARSASCWPGLRRRWRRSIDTAG